MEDVEQAIDNSEDVGDVLWGRKKLVRECDDCHETFFVKKAKSVARLCIRCRLKRSNAKMPVELRAKPTTVAVTPWAKRIIKEIVKIGMAKSDSDAVRMCVAWFGIHVLRYHADSGGEWNFDPCGDKRGLETL